MCFFEVLTPFPDDFKKWVNVFLISALPETLRINMAATSSAASNNNIMASSPQDSDAWALLSLKEANTMPSPTTTNSSPASHKHINESTNGGQKPALGKWHFWCRILICVTYICTLHWWFNLEVMVDFSVFTNRTIYHNLYYGFSKTQA